MKRLIPYILSLAASQALIADCNEKTDLPISIYADYNHISKAKFKHPRHSRLSFSEERALAVYTHEFNSQKGMTLGVGYLGTKFHLSHHQAFKQKHFDNILLNVGGFTKEVEKWRWDANLYLQMNTEHFSLSRYTFFTGLLQGQYQWHSKRNLHVGILAYGGMRYSRILPVIGIDYKKSERWKFNLVFPCNVSAVYNVNSNWSAEVGLRYFLTRQRLQKDDELRRGLVAYRGWGAEAGLNYKCNDHISLNIHVGESLAGRLRVSEQNDKHRHHYKMKPAPYFGLMAKLAF